MSYTSYNLSDNGHPQSNGASADYGFDKMIYFFLGEKTPTENNIENLSTRYKEIIGSIDDSRMVLHKNYIDRTLKTLLGNGFEWVRTTNDLTM